MTPISRLLALESTHVVAFDRQGREIAWPAFQQTVAGIAVELSDRAGSHWAVDTADCFEYACALFACWCAGKTPVLAPAHMIRAGGAEFDGVIAAGDYEAGSKPLIRLDRVEQDMLSDPIIASGSDLLLFTSGSTGEPTRVQRHLLNLETEIGVLESLFGETIGGGRVYSTVSQRHVYGLLFRLLWPLLTRRAFASFDFDYPEQLLGTVGDGNTLVTSPALLKRIGHLPAEQAGGWNIIFSSGGMLPLQAARDADRLLGCTPVEVLGSTETSGVAWRRQQEHGEQERWHTLPEVRVRQDEEGFLEVSSPFMGLSAWHRMGDKVRLDTGRSFELLGRGDHIVKIEEKRVSLAEVEQCASRLPLVADAAAAALEDDARQYVGLAVQLSESGRAELETNGRKAVSDMIRQALRDSLDPVAVPKKFRYVEEIPVNPQGKREAAVVQDLFD